MIPQVHKRGRRTIGLLHYLYGPGTHEEHIDPHLVAAWDGLAPDPGRDPDATLAQLQQLLDQPVLARPEPRRPQRHVWHLSVRAAPEDPVLTDRQWAEIAQRMVTAAGIAPKGDDAACRWVAVRHAEDHIHIVATLVREDGRTPRFHRDAARVQAEARRVEEDYGLRRLNTGDGTAARRPTSAERHKARRHQRQRTAREELREAVRQAVAGARVEEEFFARLAGAGLLVRRRTAPSGDLLGYTVALPDDRNRAGEPVFYSGSKLAPDLSLPRIRERLSTRPAPAPDGTAHAGNGGRTARSRRSAAAARKAATQAVWAAVLIIEHGGDAAVAAQLAGAGEVLDALAKTSAAHTRRQLREAAFAFERATRFHLRARRRHDQALRRAARELVLGGPAMGRGEDAGASAMLIDMLIFLAIASARWHAKNRHAQQAAAARQASQHLRAAYAQASASPMAALRQRGRHLPSPERDRLADAVRTALPQLAQRVLDEASWPALAATLADAEGTGHDPSALLAQAVGQRELASAHALSDVLIWRLRRIANLPAAGETARGTKRSAASLPSAEAAPGHEPGPLHRRR
ncbi:relaxase/mobilization nuclease domain-containing protein [Streptomyces sp. YIM 98790]|uniref:relaxase/mobilization nuclease domain-containing protein n=1 Tax=Streptomyces sp. YIM 98790 TaxID=2689077 RepID=UPI00140ABC92|nr:relaxase/mobilization nuclease domain-containing protein [Streptomyces sp. YIM 98790]